MYQIPTVTVRRVIGFRGQDPAVVRTERYENAFIVALIVRK